MSLLGTMMLRAGLLSADQLAAVQAHVLEHKNSFVESVLNLGFADQTSIVSFLHSKLMIPRVGAAVLQVVDDESISRVPAELAHKHTVLPVSTDEAGNLTLAMADPTDMKTVDAISEHTGAYLVRAVAPLFALREAIEQYYGARPDNKPAHTNKPTSQPRPAPSVAAPSTVAAPAVSAPSAPAVKAPSAPSVKAPSAPSVKAPSAPSVAAPSISAPSVSAPSISPPVAAPSLSPPSVSVPAPSVSAPSVKAPSISAPSVSAPSIAAPAVSPPSVSAPSIAAPSVSAPAVSAPSIGGKSGPSIAAPTLAPPPTVGPKKQSSPLAAPSLAAPSAQVPSNTPATLAAPSAQVPSNTPAAAQPRAPGPANQREQQQPRYQQQYQQPQQPYQQPQQYQPQYQQPQQQYQQPQQQYQQPQQQYQQPQQPYQQPQQQQQYRQPQQYQQQPYQQQQQQYQQPQQQYQQPQQQYQQPQQQYQPQQPYQQPQQYQQQPQYQQQYQQQQNTFQQSQQQYQQAQQQFQQQYQQQQQPQQQPQQQQSYVAPRNPSPGPGVSPLGPPPEPGYQSDRSPTEHDTPDDFETLDNPRERSTTVESTPSSSRDTPYPAAAGARKRSAGWNPPQQQLNNQVTPLSPEAFSRILPRFATVTSRDQITGLLLDFLGEGFERVIMFVHIKGEIRGRDARGEDLMVEAVRQIRIPAGGPSLFSTVIEHQTPYFGPMRTDTAIDSAFFSALGGVHGNVLVVPVILRKRVPLLVFASGARHAVDANSLHDLTETVGQAFERLIVADKARR